MSRVPPNSIALPTVVLFELHINLVKSRNSGRRATLLQAFVAKSLILPLDQNAAICAARIRAQLEQRGQPIGPFDTLIAGIAMASQATLVTHSTRESKVEGLMLEDWY